MLNILVRLFIGIVALAFGSDILAAEAGATFINYYAIILGSMGLNEEQILTWTPVMGGALALIIISVIGGLYSSHVKRNQSQIEPDGRFNLVSVIEVILEFVYKLIAGVIGEKKVAPFLPLLMGVFVFIFVCNLTGLVPGFIPATESISTNLVLALMVFFIYNIAGIKEHGASYMKQFIGPIVFLMPLMLVIELIAHLARPISLSLRLYGNIFGDHLVLSVFTGLTVVPLPAFLLFFGFLVASIQSFVFTLLSSIYISMAVSHDH